MIAPGIVFIVLGAVLFVLAYFLYYKEAYWLISGLNFSSRQQAYERYDIPGLTKHMGRMCLLLGLIMLISGAGAIAGLELLFLIPFGFLFIILPVFLFGTERFLYEGRKKQRIINLVITLFMTAVAVFVIAVMISGTKAPVVRIIDDHLVIESIYGTEIPLDAIRQISMTDLEGRRTGKINGFSMGNYQKGRFAVEGLNMIMLYQNGEPCNSILIKTATETYLINMGSEAENEALRSQIEDAMK